MRGLKSLSIAAILMAAVSGASGNPVPDDLHDDEPEAKEDKKGGNAIDKTTAAGTERPLTGAGSLPPEGYAIIGDFLTFVATGDVWSAAGVIEDAWDQPEADSASPFSWLTPTDGPAESILDQMDEGGTPLPMVGEPGSEVTVAPEEPTPPPESILDFIDPAPAAQSAAGAAQDTAKPAVDQASRPAVMQTPPP
jgi:hypothetical protein